MMLAICCEMSVRSLREPINHGQSRTRRRSRCAPREKDFEHKALHEALQCALILRPLIRPAVNQHDALLLELDHRPASIPRETDTTARLPTYPNTVVTKKGVGCGDACRALDEAARPRNPPE